jgi:hypothetical protein
VCVFSEGCPRSRSRATMTGHSRSSVRRSASRPSASS